MSFSSVIDNFLLSRDVGRFRKMKFGSDTQFAEFDKYLIRYKLCGSGDKTVVFIPNAPNTIEHYDKLAQLLSQNFQVLIFELPGFGFSVPKRANYDYALETMTQVGIDLLDRLQIKDAIFALSCVGGYITLKTAELRPDLVGNIVSIQTLCWDEQKEWVERINKRLPIKTPILGQILSRILRSKITKQWYERVVPEEQAREGFIKTAFDNLKKGANYSIATANQALFNTARPVFKPLEMSALIIWGSKDRSHLAENHWSMLQYLSNFEPHEFESSGHFPELEQPERFTRILRERFGLKLV